MRVARRFTEAGTEVYDRIEFRRTSSEIRNPDGSLVFRAEDIEVPSSWSQVACDVLAQKYFRKRGLPLKSRRVPEDNVPAWLWRSARSEEHTSELQSLMRISYAVFCLNKKNNSNKQYKVKKHNSNH